MFAKASAHPALAWRYARPGSLFAMLLICGVCLMGLPPQSAAQKSDKPVRKLLYRESPGYPLTLREAHIGGIVRLEITISPRGSVEQVSALGGNPVLVEAASAAVRKWKYAAGDSETKTQVEFTFDPRR
jgi:TonB family C-terminal domain